MSKSQGSRYIWDEIEVDEDDDQKDYSVSAMSSITRHDDFDAFEAKYEARSIAASRDIESIKSAADEISRKIKTMKKDYQEKSQMEKDLFNQLQNTKLVKERRSTKIRTQYETQLAAMQKEFELKNQKTEEFINKLTQDIKEKAIKKNALLKTIENNKIEKENVMLKTNQDLKRNIQRMKRQLEADEKVSFDKASATKSEVMKKQAADALTPKLDKMVKDNKQAVILHREAAESSLEKLKRSWQAKYDKKVNDFAQQLTQENDLELEKIHKQNKAKLEEIAKKHETDLQTVRNRFQTEKSYLEESHDKSIRTEMDSHQERLQLLNKKDNSLVEDLLDKQQREVGYLTQMHHEAVAELQKSIRLAEKEHSEKTLQRNAQLQQQRKERMEQQISREVNAETNAIVQKLREEAAQTRAKLQADLEKEVDDLRLKLDSKMEITAQNEQKLQTSTTTYKVDIDSFTNSIATLTSSLQHNQSLLNNELKPQLTALRKELRAVEDEWAGMEDRHQREREERESKRESELDQAREQERGLEEELSAQKVSLREKKQRMGDEYQSEISSIKAKIARMLGNKEKTVRDLSDQLQQLQSVNSDLLAEIDDLRDNAYD